MPGQPHMQILKAAGAPELFVARPDATAPRDAQLVLVHVRDYTNGLPSILDNNHPVRHDSVIVVHNGRIQNDEELFAEHQVPRWSPHMTVDSEAICMLLHELGTSTDESGGLDQALRGLIGSYAFAAYDERHPGRMLVVRGNRRPLVVVRAPGLAFCCSTPEAAQFAISACSISHAHVEVVPPRTLLVLEDGRVTMTRKVHVRSFTEACYEPYDVSRGAAAQGHVLRLYRG